MYGICTANNVLEFLAMAISLWMTLLKCKREGKNQELILALGDNISVICWFEQMGNLGPGGLSYRAAKFIVCKVVTLVDKSSNFFDTQHVKEDWLDRLTFEGDN